MNREESADPAVERGFAKIELEAARRHVFLCVGPDCCSSEQGLLVWEHLKQSLKAQGLPILRTKAACFRICGGGPWLVVYPEGVWYGALTVDRCERIVADHLVRGKIVAEWASRIHPLPPADLSRL